MRIRLFPLDSIFPVLLILAVAVSVQAQTNSNYSATAGSDNTETATSKSRFRFVPTSKPNDKALDYPAGVDAFEFGDSNAAQSNQHDRVASLMPRLDQSTSPRRLNPAIDGAAFTAPVAYEAPQVENNNWDSPYYSPNPAANRQSVNRRIVVEQVSHPQTYQSQPIYVENTVTTYLPAMPTNQNFFGVSECECCDEWKDFSNCGGLKANPGHYGLKWFKGKDACEQNGCGCKRCKLKTKRGNESGCDSGCDSSSNNGCDGGCDECSSSCKKPGGIKTRHGKKSSDCGCSSCKSGGLFSR